MGDIFDDARPLIDKWKAEANQKKRSSRMAEKVAMVRRSVVTTWEERAQDDYELFGVDWVKKH